MNTNQRIKETEAYQYADESWNSAPTDAPHMDMPVPDFVRIYSPRVKSPRVSHRITWGWTSRDVLIARRDTCDDIPF